MAWLNQFKSQIQNFAQDVLDPEGNGFETGAATNVPSQMDTKSLLEDRARLQDSLLQLDQQYQEERKLMISIKEELQSKLQQAETELATLKKASTGQPTEQEVKLDDDDWGNDNWGPIESNSQLKLDERAHELVELQRSLDEAQRQLAGVHELRAETESLRRANETLTNRMQALEQENEMLEAELDGSASKKPDQKEAAENDYELFCREMVSALLGSDDLNAERLNQAKQGLQDLSTKVKQFESTADNVACNINDLEDQKNAILAEKNALREELNRLAGVEAEVSELRDQFKKASVEKSALAAKIEKTKKNEAELKAQVAELSARIPESSSEGKLQEEFEQLERTSTEQIQELQLQLSKANSELAEKADQLEKQLTSANIRETGLNQEIMNLQMLLHDLEKEVPNSRDQVASLLKQTREQESEIQQLRAELSIQREENADLAARSLSNNGDENVESLQQRIETNEQELDLLKHSRDSVVAELETSEYHKQQALAQIQSLQQELEAMKIMRQSFDQGLKQVANEKEQMVAVVSEKSRENAELKQKLDGLMGALSSEKQARLQMEQRLVELQNQNVEVPQVDLSSFHEKIASLETELQNINRTLVHKNQENAELRQRIQKLLDNESKLKIEIQRLTSHLVEVEESYTKEALCSEQLTTALQQKLAVLEESARHTDTSAQAMTAMASQKVEMLEAELSQAMSQRDEALDQVSTLEDQVQQSAVSLASLQLVLEHMQRERDNGTKSLKKLNEAETKSLTVRIAGMEKLLQEKDHLIAGMKESVDRASQLSHQIEEKNASLNRVHQKLGEKEEELRKLMEQVKKNESTEGKVEKQLIKNMLLGYFCAQPDKKIDVLRCIAGYLEFSESESCRLPLNTNKGLFGLFSSAQQHPQDPNESFTNQLIAFLERESTPNSTLKLPTEPTASTSDKLRKISTSSCPPERQRSSTPFRPDNPLFNHLAMSPVPPPASTSSRASTTSEPDMLRELLNQPGSET